MNTDNNSIDQRLLNVFVNAPYVDVWRSNRESGSRSYESMTTVKWAKIV